MNIRNLALLAGAMRVDAAASMKDLGRKYPIGDRLAFLGLSTGGRELDDVWSYFFAGCIVLISAGHTGAPVVCYYNGFVDAAVYCEWTIGPSVARLERAWCDLGSEEELVAKALLPRWLRSDELLGLALRRQVRGFVEDFDRRFSEKGPAPRLPGDPTVQQRLDLVRARLLASMTSLQEPQEAAARQVRSRLEDFRSALTRGDAGWLTSHLSPSSPVTGGDLVDIPSQRRAALVPVELLRGDRTTTAMLIVPELPTCVVMVEVPHGSVDLGLSVGMVAVAKP